MLCRHRCPLMFSSQYQTVFDWFIETCARITTFLSITDGFMELEIDGKTLVNARDARPFQINYVGFRSWEGAVLQFFYNCSTAPRTNNPRTTYLVWESMFWNECLSPHTIYREKSVFINIYLFNIICYIRFTVLQFVSSYPLWSLPVFRFEYNFGYETVWLSSEISVLCRWREKSPHPPIREWNQLGLESGYEWTGIWNQ